jgi:hypothetical protein
MRVGKVHPVFALNKQDSQHLSKGGALFLPVLVCSFWALYTEGRRSKVCIQGVELRPQEEKMF